MIPLENGGFKERHIQLQSPCGFLGVNQAFLNNHCVIWASERKHGGFSCKNPPGAQVKVLPMAIRPYGTCPSILLPSDLLAIPLSCCDISLLTVFTHMTLSSTLQYFNWPLSFSGILFAHIGISSRLLLKCQNLRKNFPDHSF